MKKIFIKDIYYGYSNQQQQHTANVLEGVSLNIRQGEFVCIVGASGCGKSTLLNIIGGLLQPSSGSIMADASPITGPGRDRGMVFQGYALLPWRTVLKNIELGLEINGFSKNQRRKIAREYLHLVGLSAYERYYPSQLSGGMKQRVAIARALAYNPEVLLMDEPFSALDAQTREILQEELLEIWKKTRKTIVFVTHSVDEAVFLANRIVIMGTNPGRVIETIPIDLPHPRSQGSKEFQQLRSKLWLRIKEEVHLSSSNSNPNKGDLSYEAIS